MDFVKRIFFTKYYVKVLQPNEEIIAVARLHRIQYLKPCCVIVFSFVIFIFGEKFISDPENISQDLINKLALVVFLIGVFLTKLVFLRRYTTELTATSKRLIKRTGIITRDTYEISLNKIDNIDVIQPLLGRILNYGNIVIHSISGAEQVKQVAKPLDFRNSILMHVS